MGEVIREGILSKCKTKIFLSEDHAATRQWAAEQVGKCLVERGVYGRSWQKDGTGRSESTQLTEDWRVRPERLATLKRGGPKNKWLVESYVLKEGVWALVRWHQEKPGKSGTVRIA